MLSRIIIASLVLLPAFVSANANTKNTIQLMLSQDDLTKLCIYDNKFYSIGSVLTLPDGKNVVCERQEKAVGMKLQSAEWVEVEQ